MQKLRLELADKICLLEEAQEKLDAQKQLNEKSARTINGLLNELKSLKAGAKRSKLQDPIESSIDITKEVSFGFTILYNYDEIINLQKL